MLVVVIDVVLGLSAFLEAICEGLAHSFSLGLNVLLRLRLAFLLVICLVDVDQERRRSDVVGTLNDFLQLLLAEVFTLSRGLDFLWL